MTKRNLIDEILTLNSTAQAAFLARFPDAELSQYLDHLKAALKPRLSGDASRFAHYFGSSKPVAQAATAAQHEQGSYEPLAQEAAAHDEQVTSEEKQMLLAAQQWQSQSPSEEYAPDWQESAQEEPQLQDAREPQLAAAGHVLTNNVVEPFAQTQQTKESWLF